MGKIGAALYGLACYTLFFIVFLYAVGFVNGQVVPKSIDSGNAGPLIDALLVNLLLLGLFAVQHSVMARPAFKRWWTQYLPKHVERSTYVLLSSLCLALLFSEWRPIPALVWGVENPAGVVALQLLRWAGWLIVLISTFLISHFDLFGLRQVYLHLRGATYTFLPFSKTGLYKLVRHPIMLGFLIAFWAAPTMSAGHLAFALATTAYILVALRLEERDLVSYYGDDYKQYQQQVPMLLPGSTRR